MENKFDDIIKLLEPLRLRIFFIKMIKWFNKGLFAGSLLSLLLSLMALILPFTFDIISVVQVFFLSIAIIIPLAIIAFPDNNEVLRVGDSFDDKERLLTGLELQNNYDPVAIIQRVDTYNHFATMRFSEFCPIKVNFKFLGVIAAIFIFAGGLTFIETEARIKSVEIEKLKAQASKGIQELEKIKNDINLSSELTEAEKKTLGNKIDSINEDLNKARSSEDMNKALVTGENEAKALSQKEPYLNNSLNDLRKQIIERMNKSISDTREKMELNNSSKTTR